MRHGENMQSPHIQSGDSRNMDKIIVSLLMLSLLVRGQLCPKRCICQNLSPSLAIVCAKMGLLFVPAVDHQTVELQLTDNFITFIRRKDFANMTSLLHLTLSRNTISQIMPYTFADLSRLRALHIDSNRLTVAGDDHFRGLTNLRHLILSNNQLHDISHLAFDDFLETLEDLDISYNNLVSIPWETISRLSNVNTLNMDHNLIEHVPLGIFASLHKLARLDMTSNKLKKIPPDPLFLRIPVYTKSKGSPLSSLVLSFGGNPLHCNCELLWLRRLTREDDLETCASPQTLMAKYFWTIPEEEFICEPPVMTKMTPKTVSMEGKPVSLKCKANGDPEPHTHWISPEGRLISNTSRMTTFSNGSLNINITSLKDTGTFTCIASNAAGESTGVVELVVNPQPYLANNTSRVQKLDSGPSDILTSTNSASGNGTKVQEYNVALADVTGNSALIKWHLPYHIQGIKMYQVQYNSSADDTLIYRMIPSSSQDFLVKDLVSGREYNLCVLAVYDDGTTSMTATQQIGCIQFVTEKDYSHCQFSHRQFLGGTMIIIIGGIIVASVLVFIILMVHYKVYSYQNGEPKKTTISNVHCHSKGGQTRQFTKSTSKSVESQEEQSLACSGVWIGSENPGAVTRKNCNTITLAVDSKMRQSSEIAAGIVSPMYEQQSRISIELQRYPCQSRKEGSTEDLQREIQNPEATDQKRCCQGLRNV